MIGVTTGVPGAGKTLWMITWLLAKAKAEKRTVYYSGIKDLKIPDWVEIPDPEKWMDLPKNSIVLIDEAQRIFRPRSHGTTVPKHVSDLETHRHLGIDLFLVTQHPMLIESNVRRLCGLHFHAQRKWGMQASTVHEWPTIKENCDKQRDDSVRHAFKFPKANYALYHSAEVHTHKRRLPYHLLFIAAVPFAVGYAAWRVYDHWAPSSSGRLTGPASGSAASAPVLASGGNSGTRDPAGGVGGGGGGTRLTVPQFIAQFEPRITGLAYTAPVYDTVTVPVEAPYPAACVSSAARCKCYSQQATVLTMPEEMCRQFAQDGFFVGWKQTKPLDKPPQIVKGDPPPQPQVFVFAPPIVPHGQPSMSGFVAATSGAPRASDDAPERPHFTAKAPKS